MESHCPAYLGDRLAIGWLRTVDYKKKGLKFKRSKEDNQSLSVFCSVLLLFCSH
jgi:hypothetical protein